VRWLAVTVAALVALPAAAQAAAVGRVGSALVYTAAAGDQIDGRVIATSDGAYLVRVRRGARQALRPLAGCARSRTREFRCAGAGIGEVQIELGAARQSLFVIDGVRVPVAVTGSPGSDLVLVKGTKTATISTAGGRDSAEVAGVAGGRYVFHGGDGADVFDGTKSDPGAQFEIDGGAGNDTLVGSPGVDTLAGGPGDDHLSGLGGADDYSGGVGNDTAVFTHPAPGSPPISVSLDGQRNDGTAADHGLVEADVENATIDGPPNGNDVLTGNDGPNILIGPGTVDGLGGDDTVVTDNYTGSATLVGGDGNDRIGAVAVAPEGGGSVLQPDAIDCGAGTDVVFTDPSDTAPADCEYANVGMHVLGATPITRAGTFRVRVDCTDPRPCALGSVLVRLNDHLVNAPARVKRIVIPTGGSAMRTVTIKASIWARHRNARRLSLNLAPQQYRPAISDALSTGVFPRDLTVAVAR
jgi:RTX calcium-binding nonapeptide repeat (4 copies)